ncbi:UDP-N-acetylmuramoyl-L-alanine--D-glutamate ligase [Candidatus Riesia pediculicola]|uniref:UDP-N-acetylmuramoylalanine--D-glutamate ligase n=1 Tax=Riesia pediculicola (strain USDA) TaxID=515618 RepID=D4G8R3_RIEPU|nr:UDP-N-acetylmuramoyl-L-alanine--D-glutamate ligase [Candidatus Riesia pediculicola]ADD79580.1 UDP-N-acetylmuramoylalanine--D-glutamate ligase [Candidatus Riesia pediculicola USDA]ARC53934.1 hypothetical protein AOE55_02140 [Candidatus Riesia pediculicola]QOJ86561.1 UDP-N-acetylmuramoyl-L-alanine--D-glutamate ligase [Candidatus Riesia pediculicola]
MVNYFGKKVVIIGLGKTGLSCINFFLSKKIFPKVIDTQYPSYTKHSIPEGVIYHFGSWNRGWIVSSDLIVLSPGVSRLHEEIQIAYRKGIEIIGDIELFCREVDRDKKIISITGSNGKSTTASVLTEIAKKANLKVGLGGNIGVPVLELLNYDYDIYILELSSFQLEITSTLKSIGAVILNISENHMDRYPFGMYQYLSAKLKIYDFAKNCVINIMDNRIWPKEIDKRNFLSFGINSGDYRLNTKKNTIQRFEKDLIHIKFIKIIGQHNHMNFLATLCLSEIIGIPINISLFVISRYSGLPHRLQVVHKKNGVIWINDSKSTNIESTIAALKSIKANNKIHLLLGGDKRKSKISRLKEFVSYKKKIRIYCFGKDKLKFGKLRNDSIVLNTLEQCMLKVSKNTESGDIILLSPACSSLDQFSNFEHRGSVFSEIAKKLGS